MFVIVDCVCVCAHARAHTHTHTHTHLCGSVVYSSAFVQVWERPALAGLLPELLTERSVYWHILYSLIVIYFVLVFSVQCWWYD